LFVQEFVSWESVRGTVAACRTRWPVTRRPAGRTVGRIVWITDDAGGKVVDAPARLAVEPLELLRIRIREGLIWLLDLRG